MSTIFWRGNYIVVPAEVKTVRRVCSSFSYLAGATRGLDFGTGAEWSHYRTGKRWDLVTWDDALGCCLKAECNGVRQAFTPAQLAAWRLVGLEAFGWGERMAEGIGVLR